MKTSNFKWLAAIFALVVLIPNCKKDKGNDGSEYIGNYVINSATLAEALTVPTVEAGDVSVAVGTDITQLIQAALLSAVNCSSADKSYVELRNDFSLYLSCEGLNPLNAGTWEEVSATSLKLNMNSAAIPSSPTGFVLTVTDITKDQTGLTGTTSVPLTKAMISVMIAPLQLTLSPSAPAIFLAKFSVEFNKK
jgi:hypothetical protein